MFHPLPGNWEFCCVLVLYLNKDFFNGRSPLKHLLGTQVRHTRGNPVNELQAFWRNTTLFVWPLEILVVLLSRGKRIGDFITNTAVVETPADVNSWRQDVASYRASPYTLYTLLATILYIVGAEALFTWLGF
ncbi:hypothetical protein [Hymenobacter volaticus]|uniref:RDD domain-containing protein n=1 Tax=Hymenobacter volaticus TaxID=2932254 RepID=A0ABY4GFB3_9BACT|nr:hypothetical protein [Hymenobacter volaticus]UOQ69184.1 hypothetical protein MUN86_26075 [Hymenobacter volaticus]